jgi:hypothetical protein
MKVLYLYNFTWGSWDKKLQHIKSITDQAKIEPIFFESLRGPYSPLEVESGRITHAYFDKHIREYARFHGFQAVFIVLTRYQAKRLKLQSGLRGAYQNDQDAMMEGWIVADENDEVTVGGKSINQFVKTACHELRHGLCDWYGVRDDTHEWDFAKERIDIEEAYRQFRPNSGLSYGIRNLAERLGVISRRIHRSLPIPPFNWTQVTQSYLNPDRANYPRSGVHPGTDFRGSAGDPVFAPIDGELTRIGSSREMGYWLEYRMGDEYLVALHLKEPPKRGHYKRGEQIGTLGETGIQTAPHYHLEGWYKPMNRTLLTTPASVKKHTFDILKYIGV